jgi:hypothetical protein
VSERFVITCQEMQSARRAAGRAAPSSGCCCTRDSPTRHHWRQVAEHLAPQVTVMADNDGFSLPVVSARLRKSPTERAAASASVTQLGRADQDVIERASIGKQFWRHLLG